MVRLEQVCHTALAGLRVDPDDSFVAASEVFRINRQVWHSPFQLGNRDTTAGGLGIHRLEALLDRILVAAAECRVHQVACPRGALVHPQLVAVLGGAAHLVEIAEVDLRVDALGEQVDPQGDQVDVARALAVAEQTALDPVGSCLIPELRCGHRGTTVVVRVQTDEHVLAVVQMPRHPLDRVGVDVRCRHLDRRGQVDDHLAVGGRLEDLEHLVADIHGERELGTGVALRRVLVEDGRLGNGRLILLAPARALESDVDDTLLIRTEHHIPLQNAGRVVQVHDRLLGALDRLEGAGDEFLSSLRQHLDDDVVRDEPLVDQHSHEVEVGLAGRGKTDLDLLVTHRDEQLEHDALAFGTHRVDEGLIAIAQIDGAPHRRRRDDLGWPGTVGKVSGERVRV